ncbi:hypothetical protein JCM16161A_22650 [Vulcanisaeta sp. JCM 16161]
MLEDYGPFDKLDIELSDITVFVGRNNTGKSTALEATALLLSSVSDFKITTSESYVVDVLSELESKSNYLINLRSNRKVAVVSGDLISQGSAYRIKVEITKGFEELGNLRSDIMRELTKSLTELTPKSQEILMNAFRRMQSERKDIEDLSGAFKEFIDNVVAVLNDYVNDLLLRIMIVSAYVDDELFSVALLPLSGVEVSEDATSKLKKLGLRSIEAWAILHNQLRKLFSETRIHIGKRVDVKPVRVQHSSMSSFSIKDLPPDKQTELVDLLRKEVRYFYDYRGGHVILSFGDNRVSVPYGLMGDGFKALVRMLSLIVMGVDVAVIDEPEAHLHPGFMEVLARYMVEPRFLDRIQFVMATQSLEFLDYLLNAARDKNVLDRVRLVRLYLMPDGSIDYEQLSGEEAYGERRELESDLRGP